MKITAAGSLPGTDFCGALSAMMQHLPDLLALPELPARGPGSAMIGHALGLITDLAFEASPRGWRLTTHSDAYHRASQAWWRHDLDDAEELLTDFTGALKIAVAGPWTLAASVELPGGELVLADTGARRDVAQALAAGLNELRDRCARRFPHLNVHWQCDEPSITAVRSGEVRTASGLHRHRAVEPRELVELLPAADILHCCAAGEWIDLAHSANIPTVYADARFLSIDEAGAWLEGGDTLILGALDTTQPRQRSLDEIISVARPLLREIGTQGVTLAPACGFAAWSVCDVTQQLHTLQRAADLLSQG